MYQKDVNLKGIICHFNDETGRQFANLLFGSIVLQAAIEAGKIDQHTLIQSVLTNNHKPGCDQFECDVDVVLCGRGAVSTHLNCVVDDFNQIYRFMVEEDSINVKPVPIETLCEAYPNGEVEITMESIWALQKTMNTIASMLMAENGGRPETIALS